MGLGGTSRAAKKPLWSCSPFFPLSVVACCECSCCLTVFVSRSYGLWCILQALEKVLDVTKFSEGIIKLTGNFHSSVTARHAHVFDVLVVVFFLRALRMFVGLFSFAEPEPVQHRGGAHEQTSAQLLQPLLRVSERPKHAEESAGT